MAKKSEFVEYLLELLSDFGYVRSRSMFGGYGIYRDDLMFGLVADDQLYLKVDDDNRPAFEEEGSEPFIYVKNGQPMAMSYYLVPESALDNPMEMQHWAQLAFDAALRAKKTGKKKKR